MRWFGFALVLFVTAAAAGQSSSLLMNTPPRQRATGNASAGGRMSGDAVAEPGALFVTIDPRDEVSPMTRAIEKASLFVIPAQAPRKFKVEDLITVIVRQQKKYKADAQMDSEKKWNLVGQLSDWFRMYPRNRLGQDKLTNGKPGFKFDYDNKYKTQGTNDREDNFTTSITARIIDVKPNGNLVVEATLQEQHDEETASITLTGICRGSDVTPDNTVLSTQVAELRLVEKNSGVVRDATTRGFVPRILNFGGGPF